MTRSGSSDPAPPVRCAESGDVDALTDLNRRAYQKYIARIGAEPQPMAADWGAVVRADMVWVIDGADGLAAALVLRAMPDYLLIWSVAVDPPLQARGLGRRLLRFAETRARALGYGEIRLYTNEKFTENIGLYRRVGYVTTHTERMEGRTLVHMCKAMPASR